jgi:hypothetical protein
LWQILSKAVKIKPRCLFSHFGSDQSC